jgi:hypothetical protein
MMRRSQFAIALAIVLAGAGLTHAQTASPPAAPAKNDYGDAKNWLCRPGQRDACAVDLATMIVAGDGKMTREEWKSNPNAPIDCFYVYPTVSRDPTPNSDMIPGPEENGVIAAQFARFASQCKPYAPLYRQATLTALRAAAAGTPMNADRMLAYNDVLDAWNYYLQHDNNRRGVVLIGHSQGSGVLTQLIRNEIDGKPVQSQVISSLLLGTSLPVPKGKDVGGAFQYIPLCRSSTQTGCVITYASFRSTIPPPTNTRFGRVAGENIENMMAACTNPAALGGGSGPLHAYLPSGGRSVTGSSAEPRPWVNPPKPINTRFVSVPGLLTAQCVSDEHGSYLEVTVHGNPAGPRTDDIVGDVMTNGQVNASWGLHLIDVNLAIGNLISIVRDQGKAYLASSKKGTANR